VYYKETNTGQYTHFSSFTPWRLKISWVNALYTRAKKICSEEQFFVRQLSRIRKVLSWNGYPKYISDKIIRNLIDKENNINVNTNEPENVNVNEIFVQLPYCGIKGERLVSSCIKRISRELSSKVKFKIIFKNKKVMDFCSAKDHIPFEQKTNVIYQIVCPGCKKHYIGKTNCCVSKRMHEHGEKADQPMYLHLKDCEDFKDTLAFMHLPDIDNYSEPISPDSHFLSAVLNNYKVIDVNHKWSQLPFLETYYIRKKQPEINIGLKSCKEFQVFVF
jgi:hypothetical protein